MNDRSARSDDTPSWSRLDALQGAVSDLAAEIDYGVLFRESPQPTWVEDWSAVKSLADELDWPAGVATERCLLENPARLRALYGRVRILDMNPAAVAFYLGRTPRELADRLVSEPPRGSLEAVARMVADLRAGARGMDWVQEGPADERGEPRWMRAVWYMPPASRSDWSRLIFTVQDVTRQRHTEDLLAAAKAEADAANRAKSEFLANVSHELLTPLNAVAGFSELLLEEKFGALGHDAYREYARYIRDSGEHLLDLSRIEAGVGVLKPETLDVRDVVQGAARIVHDKAGRAGLDLVVELPGQPVNVVADARKLRQILVNLLSNAIKYTRAGGRVAVACRSLGNEGVSVVVRDTGLGMRAEDIPTAMERFGRLDGTGRPDGVGLGLPLTKALVELHGGVFSLDSTPGVGTVATVVLPPAPAARGEGLSATAGPAGSRA